MLICVSSRMASWDLPSGLGSGLLWQMVSLWGFPGGSVVKNLPALQETWEMWVWSLGRVDLLGRKWQPTYSFLAQRSPMDRGTLWTVISGVKKSRTGLSNWALMVSLYLWAWNVRVRGRAVCFIGRDHTVNWSSRWTGLLIPQVYGV